MDTHVLLTRSFYYVNILAHVFAVFGNAVSHPTHDLHGGGNNIYNNAHSRSMHRRVVNDAALNNCEC